MRLPAARLCALLAGSALLLLTGCSSSSGDDIQTISPATAAQSPESGAAPAGRVSPVSSAIRAMTFDTSTGSVAALDGAGTALLIFDAKQPDVAPRSIPLPAAGVGISAGKPGEVLIPAGRKVERVDLRSGDTKAVEADGNARSAALLDHGRLAIGLADGTTRIVDADAKGSTKITGLASVDALAVTGDSLTALDRRQTSVTELDLGSKSLGLSLRAGDGATNLATDHFGRILVTDTTGGELLVLTADKLVMRQRYPVGASPYAVTYDNRADVAWVTLTGTNEVVGYDLSTGIPKEVRRFPTVRQPDSVAVDSATGTLYVGSADGNGLQTIATLGSDAPKATDGGR